MLQGRRGTEVLLQTVCLLLTATCRSGGEPAPPPSGAPAAPISAPVSPTGPPGGEQATDLCAGLVRDLDPHPMSPLAAPAVGESVIDPEFGTRIRRLTAVSTSEGENAVIKPVYSTVQAWNADESRLVLWHRGKGHELYDGRTYRFIRPLNLLSPTDLEQVLWDPIDPDVLYYPSNYNAVPNLMRYRVSTNTSVVAKHFEFCPTGDWGRLLSLGSDPMYLSWGRGSLLIGLSCGETKFLYDIRSDRVLGRTRVSTRITAQPGASGQVAWFFDGRVYDTSFRPLRTLAVDPSSHSSLGLSGTTGHDTLNTVVFDPPPGGSASADVGTLVSFDLQTGARKVVVGFATGYPYPPSGTHISAVAHKRSGWVAVSAVGNPRGQGVLDQELLLANVDTGTVCRVGHHRSFAREGRWDYWAEPHVVISPTATRLLFGSDWGNGPAVDTYVVELPAYSARASGAGRERSAGSAVRR
jgi:hypothetical protein